MIYKPILNTLLLEFILLQNVIRQENFMSSNLQIEHENTRTNHNKKD